MNLNKTIDHTLLKATATEKDIQKLCQEAKEYDFMSVCVNSSFVKLASSELADSDVKVCTVVGFPLGASLTEAKIVETKAAINNGATEIDMVLNIGALKSGNWDLVGSDIKAIKEACGDILLKVILETCYLTTQEIEKACYISKEMGADFVKTSTGFGTDGATVEHITLMRKVVGEKLGVKASGGVRSREDAVKMIEAGATRIGASSGIAIVKGENNESSSSSY